MSPVCGVNCRLSRWIESWSAHPVRNYESNIIDKTFSKLHQSGTRVCKKWGLVSLSLTIISYWRSNKLRLRAKISINITWEPWQPNCRRAFEMSSTLVLWIRRCRKAIMFRTYLIAINCAKRVSFKHLRLILSRNSIYLWPAANMLWNWRRYHFSCILVTYSILIWI